MNKESQVTSSNQNQPVSQAESTADHLLKNHARQILFGIAIIIMIAVLATMYQQRIKNRNTNAALILFSAREIGDFETVVEEYQSTDSAPLATLKLAKAHYDTGSYTLALETYDNFLEKYPEHQMREVAELGHIHCIEAQGRIDKAYKALDEFIADRDKKHYMIPQALLAKARCLRQMNRADEARQIYEQVITEYGTTTWGQIAEDLLIQVHKEIEEGSFVSQTLETPADSAIVENVALEEMQLTLPTNNIETTE